MLKLLLKLLVPYISVGIFWCLFSNGWLAILAYHLQVFLWARTSGAPLRWPSRKRMLFFAIPTIITGPLLYVLLPYVTQTDVIEWLTSYRLSGLSLVLMIPYFGIIHPMVEQIHWEPLREKTPLSHLFFAGYHMMVLYSLVSPIWLVASFIILASTSFVWLHLTRRTGSLWVAILSHILADLGLILFVYFTQN